MLFTGRRVSAREAYECGLVNHVLPAGQLDAAARELAISIANNAQSSVRGAKRIIAELIDGSHAESAETRALYDDAFSSPEFSEGCASLPRKAPAWLLKAASAGADGAGTSSASRYAHTERRPAGRNQLQPKAPT
ncbi:MAG: hypothetical protein HC942_03670, partial [Microcoleus sp. SU_5_6]|nr:hypothetical protein [Microcoleus sp. SU_5_6]